MLNKEMMLIEDEIQKVVRDIDNAGAVKDYNLLCILGRRLESMILIKQNIEED